MEILCISDLYEEYEQIEELAKILKEGKNKRIIIIAGDLGVFHKQREMNYNKNLKHILKALTKISKQVYFVPGETDNKDLKVQIGNVLNLDQDHAYIELDGVRVGLIGLGGAPDRSVRSVKDTPYCWNEKINYDNFFGTLKMQYQKLLLEKPDYILLLTHSPPFGISDYSKEIGIDDGEVVEEVFEEDKIEKPDKKKKSRNPKRLGSKVIKDFINRFNVDIHVFGHIHKEGGKIFNSNNTTFFNISHLSILPYKLTGRKYLLINLNKEGIKYKFDAVVNKNIPFEEYTEEYL